MVRKGPGQITVARVMRVAAVIALALVWCGLSAPRAQAAVFADLTVAVSGPVTAVGGAPFTYSVVVTNLGPDAADAATVLVALPTGATGAGASCTTASGGAVCPTAISVATGQASATVPTLPLGGAVTITVTGSFGHGTSATATATVSSPAGVPDPDLSNDTATQSTALSPAVADVSVSTTVDRTSAAYGQLVTYSTLVTNNGPADIVGLTLDGTFGSLKVGPQNVLTLTGTISCDPSAPNAAPCPASLSSPVPYAEALNGSQAPLGLPTVDLAAGRTLSVTVAVVFTTAHCDVHDAREVFSTIDLVPPHGQSLTGTTSATSPSVALGPCAATPSPSPVPSATPTTAPTTRHPATPKARVSTLAASSSAPVATPTLVTLPTASSATPSTTSPRYLLGDPDGGVTVAGPGMTYCPCLTDDPGGVVAGSGGVG